MHIKRLFVVVLTAGIVAAGLLVGAPAQGAAPATASAASAGIAWGPCSDPGLVEAHAQCGELRVPLDYNRPGGAKITLAVSRVLHTSSDADYQGVMLVNPGGPGGAGLGLAVLGQFVPNNAGAAYDWIGFDPRGVGASTPSLSCIPDYFGYNRPYYVPVTRALERTWLERSESYADACQQDAAALLPHMKTTDSARDMESIRKALGARQINYYGFSYGTYLAQVSSTLFPSRVRRMVLDNPAGGLIGGSEWTDAFLLAGYNQFFWPFLGDAFAAWVHNGDAQGLKDAYDAAVGPGDDNLYAVYLAVECTTPGGRPTGTGGAGTTGGSTPSTRSSPGVTPGSTHRACSGTRRPARRSGSTAGTSRASC